MAAPVFVKRIVDRISFEGDPLLRQFTGLVPTGHRARIRWRFSTVENTDYGAGGNASVFDGTASCIRNNTGTGGVTDGAKVESFHSDGTGTAAIVAVALDYSTGNLTLVMNPPNAAAITGEVVISLFSWPNTVTT